jgi:o-succinylbenzoate---CoA ligase
VFAQIQPDLVWSDSTSIEANSFRLDANASKAVMLSKLQPHWLLIPTGGSSGHIRFVIHTWATLTASVTGFQQHFNRDRIHSCCVLPLYHVSGLMQFMRSFLTGGSLAILSAKSLETQVPAWNPADFFLSLVPTQLQRYFDRADTAAIAWLSQVHTVLLGGAPSWVELLDKARHYQIRVAPTYGMTETASQVATLQPEAFLQGQQGCGRALPHAQIWVVDEQGNPLASGQIGAIVIQAQSLALGYWGRSQADEWAISGRFQTDDLGYFDAQGSLHLVGRRSRKIITGGENVFPDEVEAAIRATGQVQDVCVVGMPDRHWGEVVTAVYVPESSLDITVLKATLHSKLSRFKHPKCWIAVESLPRNAQGKVNYALVKALVR